MGSNEGHATAWWVPALGGEATQLEQLLWIVVAVSLVGDVVTTFVGLHLGFHEANPIARSAIDGWGLFGMLALKGGAVAVALCCRPLLDVGYRPIIPAALAIPWTAATAINLVVISMTL